MTPAPSTPPPSPTPPRNPATLPHPLTFFLTASQRRRALTLLKRHDPKDRAAALLRALRLAATQNQGPRR